MSPKAVFLGLWDVPGKEPIALYNVEGGRLNHSTVTKSTLNKEGIAIPKTQGSDELEVKKLGGCHEGAAGIRKNSQG